MLREPISRAISGFFYDGTAVMSDTARTHRLMLTVLSLP